jgi:hypothetical protein
VRLVIACHDFLYNRFPCVKRFKKVECGRTHRIYFPLNKTAVSQKQSGQAGIFCFYSLQIFATYRIAEGTVAGVQVSFHNRCQYSLRTSGIRFCWYRRLPGLLQMDVSKKM